jgi:hypothetical protein
LTELGRNRRPRRSARRRTRAALLTAAIVALAAPAGSAADEDLRRLRLAELEKDLARGKDLYLFLDPNVGKLTVKARGLELAAIEVRGFTRLVFEPLFGRVEAPPLPAPAIWTVLEGPGDTDRETIAPTTLRPYSEVEEREEPAPTAPALESGEAADDSRAGYRVGLDNGWQLLIVDQPPRLGWGRRFLAAVRDGWQRLRGAEPAHPPLLTLIVSEEDARRLHHLFRAGMPILVAPTDR